MRQAFAVEALVTLEAGAEPRAIGGAATLALCGAFDHPGPCPLAPHRTFAEQREDGVHVRIVLAADAEDRETVIRILAAALEAGRLVDPDGVEQRWRLRGHGVTGIRDAERALAQRLVASPG